jgi:hypothetical protein
MQETLDGFSIMDISASSAFGMLYGNLYAGRKKKMQTRADHKPAHN